LVRRFDGPHICYVLNGIAISGKVAMNLLIKGDQTTDYQVKFTKASVLKHTDYTGKMFDYT